MKAKDADREHDRPKYGHGGHLRPKDIQPGAFQKHAAQNHLKIAKRAAASLRAFALSCDKGSPEREVTLEEFKKIAATLP